MYGRDPVQRAPFVQRQHVAPQLRLDVAGVVEDVKVVGWPVKGRDPKVGLLFGQPFRPVRVDEHEW